MIYDLDKKSRKELIEIVEIQQQRDMDACKEIDQLKQRIEQLERDQAQRSLVFVGYTNGHQIEYAKSEEGCFYPDTDNNCYIPLYMLEIHEHRIETAKQLIKGE